MRRIAVITIALILLAGMLPAAAHAEQPDNPNCWGVVTEQLASTGAGVVGDHASDPPPLPEPLDRPGRAGLGNNPFGHVSELGSFLAGIDGLEATECP